MKSTDAASLVSIKMGRGVFDRDCRRALGGRQMGRHFLLWDSKEVVAVERIKKTKRWQESGVGKRRWRRNGSVLAKRKTRIQKAVIKGKGDFQRIYWKIPPVVAARTGWWGRENFVWEWIRSQTTQGAREIQSRIWLESFPPLLWHLYGGNVHHQH